MNRRDHWKQVYTTRATDQVGWYAPHLQTSIDWIGELALPADSPIIDIGCGASTLVDDLLEAGYRSITAIDIAEPALCLVRERLGAKSELVNWLAADVTAVQLPDKAYELWHDRAVFHFLTAAEDRKAYRANLLAALRPDGHLIIGTFAPEAPARCSGLPVQRYSEQQLVDELGPDFALVRHAREMHMTPGGVEQMYLYCQFRRLAEADA